MILLLYSDFQKNQHRKTLLSIIPFIFRYFEKPGKSTEIEIGAYVRFTVFCQKSVSLYLI